MMKLFRPGGAIGFPNYNIGSMPCFMFFVCGFEQDRVVQEFGRINSGYNT